MDLHYFPLLKESDPLSLLFLFPPLPDVPRQALILPASIFHKAYDNLLLRFRFQPVYYILECKE